MKYKIFGLVCAFLVGSTSTVIAADSWREPESFRGVKWGWTLQDVKKNQPKLDLSDIPQTMGPRLKIHFDFREYIGEAQVHFGYGFLDNRFLYGSISFKSKDFATIRDVFFERYGRAHSMEEVKLKNSMNAEFLNTIYRWKGPTLMITLKKYEDKITDGHAAISKYEFEDAWRRAAAQQSKDAAKGL
jgi:hypothetical protein